MKTDGVFAISWIYERVRRRTRIYCTGVGSLLMLVLYSTATSAAGENGHHAIPHHHINVFAGLGVETKRDHADEEGFAIGIGYEYRFHQNWGIGLALEGLGQDTIRDAVVVVPLSLHPGGHWRLVTGPGYEFTDTKDKPLWRLQAGYEFPMRGDWTFSPELIADFVEGGALTWIGGIAIGRTF